MDVFQAILTRRSVRVWTEKQIPRDKIEKMKDAVEWAPSAGNLQSRFFYFLFDKKKIVSLCAATGGQFEPAMPLIVVGCADAEHSAARYGQRGRELYAIMDVSASVQNLLLQAHAEGLGAVWCCAFDEEKVCSILDVPAHLRPVVLVPIGFPAEKPEPHERRKTVQEIA